jgi:hypothetical protein
MAPTSIVFPDKLFLFQTPDENDEQKFHCIIFWVVLSCCLETEKKETKRNRKQAEVQKMYFS